MRLNSNFAKRLSGLFTTTLLRRWMSTLDYQLAYYDSAADVTHTTFRGPAIFVFWHEYIPAPFYLRPQARIALLISRHTDAEWLTQAVRYVGYETVRGSSARGGAAALKELFQKGRQLNLAITPDGPRGPRRTFAQGPVFLSSKLGIPIVLNAIGYDRPWRLPTWDRFAIPRPYSRCRGVVSPLLQIPPNLSRGELEAYRVQVEQLQHRLTEEAEAWATSGQRVVGQTPGLSQPSSRCRLDRLDGWNPLNDIESTDEDTERADASPPSITMKRPA